MAVFVLLGGHTVTTGNGAAEMGWTSTVVINGDLFKLYFEEDVDLKIIKLNLIKKQEKYINEINGINARLKNKKFLDRAPKHIVEHEKTNYNNLKIDIDKISLIIKNL